MDKKLTDEQKKNLKRGAIAGGLVVTAAAIVVVHRRKVNNVLRGMQLLLEEETQAAWHDGYDEAIHRFIQGRMAGNLNQLNELAARYPAA